MRIQRQEWLAMKPEQKRKLIRKKVVKNRNKFAEKQWELLALRDKQTFWQCTKACRLADKFLAKSKKQVK
ncbi:hypothetical protein [Bacillus thuringiensis]|uniref:hypothetical protein n=1 Tax=Bacillus thuringiensis TaxID=1428 RepID=UPI0026E33596|nr:hypothetical protein [Bacillus thuringiensis]MDO6634116.1 hypothetical protein [Bacillus thuringiensis]MDO6663551.1 hypothetical protein [Bacillus thuringiensis]MDO6704276.1 hypothetical protein [Bacillus thuringiensis]